MKKLTVFIILSLFTYSIASSQGCLPEGITFSTQAQIDSFQVNYPGCTGIEGDVIIGGDWTGTNITNLTGLDVLTSIGGNLTISGNDSLTSLTGLDNLTSIAGDFTIGGTTYWGFDDGNPELSSLAALSNLTSIGGDLWIGGIALVSLTGLENLTSLPGSLTMGEGCDYSGPSASNPNLISLAGLDNLTSIGGNLDIQKCPVLINLSGLENLTTIGGYLGFACTGLTSLAGLENLTSIEGSLNISFSNNLPSLSGLENLTTIGNGLYFANNDSLNSLSGLENVTSTEGPVIIDVNPVLSNLTGLENITSTGGLSIYKNDILTNLTGLENLTAIEGDLHIWGNDSLISLAAIENLVLIEGDIFIGLFTPSSGNPSLTSLSGLDNIAAGTIENIKIMYNSSLSDCDVQSICDYLAAPNGTVEIYNNAPGCNTQQEVEEACENQCLPEGITFTTQEQIDSFQVNYPGCTEIEGDVTINGSEIANLNGLNVLTSIGGTLNLSHNYDLTNLSGLEGLINIGGDLIFYSNSGLTTITGLSNLTSLGGEFRMSYSESLIDLSGLEGLTTIGGGLYLGRNYSLSSLSGLDNLTSIGGNLQLFQNQPLTNLTGLEGLSSINGGLSISGHIDLQNLSGLDNVTAINGHLTIGGHPVYANSSLTSIAGLVNIDAGTITSITVYNNPILSNCHIQSICDFLSVPNDSVDIHDNATGCNSQQEVVDACEVVGINEHDLISLTIHPNPTDNGSITITLDNPHNLHLTCFNTYGQQVYTQELQATESVINVSTWTPGIYLAVVYENGNAVGRAKFVVQ